MYTQCSKCDTVFRLSADVLRAAGGQVRCGRCGEVFNALARLAEDPSTFSVAENHLDMETRANDILESPVPPLERQREASASQDIIEIEDIESNEVEFARLQVVEKFAPTEPQAAPGVSKPAPAPAAAAPAPTPTPAAAPRPAAPAAAKPAAGHPTNPSPSKPNPNPSPPSARAHGPTAAAPTRAPIAPPATPGAPSIRAPTPTPAPASAAPPPAAPRKATAPPAAAAHPPPPRTAPTAAAKPPAGTAATDGKAIDDGAMEFTLPPGELDRVFVEQATARQPPAAAPPLPAASEEDDAPPSPPSAAAGLEVSEHVRRDVLAGISELGISEPGIAEPEISGIAQEPRPAIPAKVWVAAAIVLALLLCVQLIHANREWLATHAPLRGPLRGLYAALGVTVAVPANLSAYQLRQWGVTGDPSASGTLRVRASILNTAAQLQPYPLLRVTLANRFGTKLGTRDFEPAEYMGKPIVRMLAPGERADATLDIVDPGKDAEGFEIDVCIRGADQKVSCAGDAAAQSKQPRTGA